MEQCKLLAFLLCEKATAGPDGKVTLQGLFDRIIIPKTPTTSKLIFVFYKVVVKQPCIVSLKVVDSTGRDIRGNWRDVLSEIGPTQAVWALSSKLFRLPGPHVLELKQEAEGAETIPLSSTVLYVDQQDR